MQITGLVQKVVKFLQESSQVGWHNAKDYARRAPTRFRTFCNVNGHSHPKKKLEYLRNEIKIISKQVMGHIIKYLSNQQKSLIIKCPFDPMLPTLILGRCVTEKEKNKTLPVPSEIQAVESRINYRVNYFKKDNQQCYLSAK